MSVFGFLLSALVFRLFPKSLNFEYFFSLWIAFSRVSSSGAFDWQKSHISKNFYLSAERGFSLWNGHLLIASRIHVLLLRFADQWAACVSRNSHGIR
jgi:hypothetical protein